jgi:hypothetical protein
VSEVHRLRRRFKPRRRPRFSGLSFNQLIPNILTMLGLCAGLTSIRFALEGRFGAAVTAIAVAACIDGLDGRIARLLKGTSRFGAEFDSLADFLCFGVAPALVLYMWSPACAATATRLASCSRSAWACAWPASTRRWTPKRPATPPIISPACLPRQALASRCFRC